MSTPGYDPVIADLQTRVAALETQLANLAPSEALQPTYLTVNPDGTVSANFTGHLHAKGIDLGVDINVYSPDNKVEWETAAGTEAAEIGVQLAGADLRSLLRLLAVDTNGTGDVTSLTLAAGDAAGPGSLSASIAPAAPTVIIDGAGKSSFVQADLDLFDLPQKILLHGPYSTLVPAIAAGGFATVLVNGMPDLTASTSYCAFGNARVAAGNQRIALQGFNVPGAGQLNLLFYNPTGAASAANIPFVFSILEQP